MNNKSETVQLKIAIISRKNHEELLNYLKENERNFKIYTFSRLKDLLIAKKHSVYSLIFLDAAIFADNTQNYFPNECCSQLVIIANSKQINQLKHLRFPVNTQFLLKPVRKQDINFFLNFQIAKSDLNFNKTNPDLTERLKIAIKSMGIEIFEWDLKDKLLWNQSSEHYSQSTLSQFQNRFKKWMQNIHPQDLPRIKKELDLALAGDKPFDTEFRIVAANGEIRHFRGIAALIKDEQNNPIKMVGINYNITSQKKAQLELKTIQTNLKESMKFAHLGSWKVNLETNETWWSDEFYRICGFEPGTVVPDSLKIYQLVHKNDLKKVVKLIKTTIASGKPGNMELRLMLPDNTQRKVHLLAKTTFENETLFLTGFFQDITRVREAEKKFKIAFRSSPSWIIISEIETGMMLDVNETFLKETGYERDEVIGKTSLELGLWRNIAERN
ncbi:MAG: PAS domain-containing protein, partial [Myxococcota bacterium]